MANVTKKELIEYVAANNDLTKAKAKEVVDGLFNRITSELNSGNEVAINGFGKFFTKDRAERTSHGFGKETVIPAATVVKFKPSKTLKDEVQ